MRPDRVNHSPVITHNKRPVKDVLDRLPAKMLARFTEDPALDACCSDAMNHTVEFAKTHPDAKHPDRATFECSTCGKRHIRLAIGGGTFE